MEDLIPAVLAGQIRIPAFQRPMRWDAEDALALLDSVDRGFPIGTLLLWQRPAAAERLVHGTVTVDAPARADALWVVDGQQRIVSLTRVFAGAGHPEEPFAAFYDLQTRKFCRFGRRESPPPHALPLTEALDSSRLVEWLVAHHELGLDRQAATQLGKRLREYELPAYVLTTDDERIVREVFGRANRTGKRLEDSEVFRGLYGARGRQPADLQEVASSLRDLGMGPIAESDLYNMLLATRGTDLSKDRVPALEQAEAERATADTARAARSALRFLREDAAIPHLSLLPYQPPLLALARFFHRHPSPHPRSLELLARWIWRGAVTGVHGGSTVKVRQMLAAIDDDEAQSVRALLDTVPRTDERGLDLDDYSVRYARTKLQLLALLSLGPRDLRTGVPIVPGDVDAEGAYRELVHTIVPRDLGAAGLQDRMFHPSVAGGLARAVVACEEPELVASHAISPEARRALKFDRFEDFLARRRADLFAVVTEFLDRRAAWDELDTPPVEFTQLPASAEPA